MEYSKNIKLAPYTTFKIGGVARFFCIVKNLDGLREALKFATDRNLKIFVLGGGSNVLICDDGFDGLVIKMENTGREIVSEDGQTVRIKVAAGENWDKFVEYCVSQNFWGVENLSHIPGNTGSVAVQNVGAYGQEASQSIDGVEVLDTTDGKVKYFINDQLLKFDPPSIPPLPGGEGSSGDCQFSYRSSIFNRAEKGRYIILSITFKLQKNGLPNVTYKDLAEKFKDQSPAIGQIRAAIIQIRDKKYPFPTEAKNGSVGSFFKNLILQKPDFDKMIASIKQNFGDLVLMDVVKKCRKQEDGSQKVPTAALMEICGLKGLDMGGATINFAQPLIILNKTGTATARDVLSLAHIVQETLRSKCGASVEFEPELIGF